MIENTITYFAQNIKYDDYELHSQEKKQNK